MDEHLGKITEIEIIRTGERIKVDPQYAPEPFRSQRFLNKIPKKGLYYIPGSGGTYYFYFNGDTILNEYRDDGWGVSGDWIATKHVISSGMRFY